MNLQSSDGNREDGEHGDRGHGMQIAFGDVFLEAFDVEKELDPGESMIEIVIGDPRYTAHLFVVDS